MLCEGKYLLYLCKMGQLVESQIVKNMSKVGGWEKIYRGGMAI